MRACESRGSGSKTYMRALRESRGVELFAVSNLIGVTGKSYSRWEQFPTAMIANLRLGELASICAMLDADPYETFLYVAEEAHGPRKGRDLGPCPVLGKQASAREIRSANRMEAATAAGKLGVSESRYLDFESDPSRYSLELADKFLALFSVGIAQTDFLACSKTLRPHAHPEIADRARARRGKPTRVMSRPAHTTRPAPKDVLESVLSSRDDGLAPLQPSTAQRGDMRLMSGATLERALCLRKGAIHELVAAGYAVPVWLDGHKHPKFSRAQVEAALASGERPRAGRCALDTVPASAKLAHRKAAGAR